MAARKRRTQTVNRDSPDFDLGNFIDSMKVEHIQCRDFSHSWRPYTAKRTRDGYFEQVLRCSRCRTLRKRTLSRTGAVLSSNYEYADNYVIKGLGRVTGTEKDHLRLISIEKLLVEDTAEK